MAVTLEERVDHLDAVLGQFIAQTSAALIRMERDTALLKQEMRAFKNEMQAFKDEMQAFKDEMQAFKDEMQAFKDEMLAFKDEMREFKNEMLAFKDEMREFKEGVEVFKAEMLAFKDEMRTYREKSDRESEKFTSEMKQFHRELGDIANKQGLLSESLVAPSIPRIIREYFELEPEDHMVNRRRRDQKGEWREFDVITLAGEYVFLTSTKTTLRNQYVKDFEEEIQIFRETLPEFSSKKLIGILAALDIPEAQLKYAERRGFLVLGIGEDIMEVKNTEGFKPKVWD